MKPVDFPERNIMIAEDQPEYLTLPAFWNPIERSVTFCMELDMEETKALAATGQIFLKLQTFGQPMQPMATSTIKEHLIPKEFIK